MIIKIDDRTRIGVSESCFALLRPGRRDGRSTWVEEMWFSSLERCIQHISQRRLSESKEVVSLEEFLTAYRGVLGGIRNIHAKNII